LALPARSPRHGPSWVVRFPRAGLRSPGHYAANPRLDPQTAYLMAEQLIMGSQARSLGLAM